MGNSYKSHITNYRAKKEGIEGFGVNALNNVLQITDYTLPIADRMDCVIVAVAHDEFKGMTLEDVKKCMNNKPALIDGMKREGILL